MMSAGFVVSPLLLTTEDAARFYKGGEMARPAACAVELEAGNATWWKARVGYRVYKVNRERF